MTSSRHFAYVLSDVVLKRRVTLDNAGIREESAIGVLILQREAKRVTLLI